MAGPIKLNIGGQIHDVVEVAFTTRHEEWNDYELADGGRVRLKTSAQKIYRVLGADGKPAFTSEGDPHVMVRHATQISTSR